MTHGSLLYVYIYIFFFFLEHVGFIFTIGNMDIILDHRGFEKVHREPSG